MHFTPVTDDPPWRVLRQDDNGQVFIVATAATREQAQAIADELEARGHKQMYWVDFAGSPPDRLG